MLIHGELSKNNLGASMRVLNELKTGLDEKIYEDALVVELEAAGHRVEQQRQFPVDYRGARVGVLIPDLIVDGKAIVDPKVVISLTETHLARMAGYLALTGLELAILINFKQAKLEWKRVVRQVGRVTADETDRADCL